MIIDGRAIARDILEDVRGRLPAGSRPVLRAISVAPNAATRSYLRMKSKAAEQAGMVLDVRELPDAATTEDVVEAVIAEGAQAVIVQLPLPAHLDQARILDAISLEQDADVLSSDGYVRFLEPDGRIMPPVAAAVGEVLSRAGTRAEGKKAVVIGKGKLVGAPVADLLTIAGAEVTVYDEHSFVPEALKEADIVVSGAGVPRLITPDLLKPGVVLIDAGTSEQGGIIVGDCDPACAEIASVFTPVPGGVGPIAVACLFRNAAWLLPR